MARKPKRDDLAKSKPSPQKPVSDPGRQPRVVGWLVLIVGGLSTWYWYRPLPDTVTETVHSTIPASWPTSTSSPKSLWSNEKLELPNTADVRPEIRTDFANRMGDESGLVGEPKVSLVPWNDSRVDIRDVIKTERVPMVPVTPNLKAERTISNLAPVWAPESQRSSSSWPDEGYVPPAKPPRHSASKITAPIPPFLETGMKSIRPLEFDESSSTREKSNTANTETAAVPSPEPARQPQFIRQPKR